jgi:hypothetical protein
MRAIYEAAVAQIDILSACHLSCANCTRFVGHSARNYTMSVDCFRKAVKSLDGFPGRIGIMGGEPTLHPRFREILAVYRGMVPLEKRELWTSGWRWTELAEEISETFEPDLVHYNSHEQFDGKHQPLGVSVREVAEDEDLMWELIDNCPFQMHWSPVINDRGAFFCEIAGAQDRVMGGPGGWSIEPGWWDKTPKQFQDQVERYCPNCSGCLPMPAVSDGRGGRDGPTVDIVSPGNLERLKAAGSPKILRGHYEIFDRTITRDDIEDLRDWSPREFRTFVAHSPEDVAANV